MLIRSVHRPAPLFYTAMISGTFFEQVMGISIGETIASIIFLKQQTRYPHHRGKADEIAGVRSLRRPYRVEAVYKCI